VPLELHAAHAIAKTRAQKKFANRIIAPSAHSELQIAAAIAFAELAAQPGGYDALTRSPAAAAPAGAPSLGESASAERSRRSNSLSARTPAAAAVPCRLNQRPMWKRPGLRRRRMQSGFCCSGGDCDGGKCCTSGSCQSCCHSSSDCLPGQRCDPGHEPVQLDLVLLLDRRAMRLGHDVLRRNLLERHLLLRRRLRLGQVLLGWPVQFRPPLQRQLLRRLVLGHRHAPVQSDRG
jgi:hypothetical protein